MHLQVHNSPQKKRILFKYPQIMEFNLLSDYHQTPSGFLNPIEGMIRCIT